MASWIEINFFMINMLPLCLTFSAKLKKREHFFLRLLGGIFCCLLCSNVITMLTAGFCTYLSGFCILVLFCFFLCRISFKESLYCVALSYVVQHISHCLYLILFWSDRTFSSILTSSYILCALVVCVLIYYMIGRKLPEDGRYDVGVSFSLLSFLIIILIVLILSWISTSLNDSGNSSLYYLCQVYDMLCCIFVMWVQIDYKIKLKKQREQEQEKQIWLKQKELYRLRRDDVERINLLCHDLKKQLEPLKLFQKKKTEWNIMSR